MKQVSPTIDDLTGRAVSVDDRTVETTRPARGARRAATTTSPSPCRPRTSATEMLAGRISLVVDGEVVAQSLITGGVDRRRGASTRIDPHVAHYTGQAELAAAIADGLAARAAGTRAAEAASAGPPSWPPRPGTTARSAAAARRRHRRRRAGTVRLRGDVTLADTMALDTRSTRTVRLDGTSVV